MIRDGVFLMRAFATVSLWLGLISLARALTGAALMPAETHGAATAVLSPAAWSVLSAAQAAAMLSLLGSPKLLMLSAVATAGAAINLAIAFFAARADLGFLASHVAAAIGVMHCVVAVAAAIDAAGAHLAARGRAILQREDDHG